MKYVNMAVPMTCWYEGHISIDTFLGKICLIHWSSAPLWQRNIKSKYCLCQLANVSMFRFWQTSITLKIIRKLIISVGIDVVYFTRIRFNIWTKIWWRSPRLCQVMWKKFKLISFRKLNMGIKRWICWLVPVSNSK